MGGCRCYFRDCHVSSQKFPGMHFFRFPLKEVERYRKWRLYSQMDQMLKFSEVRRKNTSICARHFRTECFMNYKMDRLTPNAMPTIMRLSDDKALDFELDIESGVLVNLEQPKLKHLLSPDGFEYPLFLINDKILLEKLNNLQNQECITNEHMEFIDLEQEECDDSVEVIETIQIAAPRLKRSRQNHIEEKGDSGIRDKKCRILNASNCIAGNDAKTVSTVVLASIENEFENGEINFVETIQIENANEFTSDDGRLLLTSESFIADDCNEDLEIFEIHKNEKDLHNELPINGSDVNIVQINTQNRTYDPEQENVEKQLLEFDQIKQDFDTLYIKYSILEAENKELKKDYEEIEEIKTKQLLLQVENNDLNKSLKDFNSMREKLHKYTEETQKLKNEAIDSNALKSELMSTKEETKELKKVLDTIKCENSKKQNIELEIKTKEINGLKNKLQLLQQKFNDTVDELKKVQTTLNNVENENRRLIQHENELKKYIEDIQSDFELKQNELIALKGNFENLQLKETGLEQKYWKLLALQNQEATVSTSLEKAKNGLNLPVTSVPSISATSLTKAQLFHGIKRYLCSSMVSLLRMEMFGNTEREWKSDERQVAVDILRLGESPYKYFTDEWRIRLPALRDARDWLSQSQEIMEDEEDL